MKDLLHRTATGEFSESSVTRVSMDYCYLTEDVKAAEDDHGTSETAKKSMTVLVMKETLCQSVWAYACESKGGSEQWLVEQIAEDMETIGITNERIILKGDQEVSITRSTT